jgi:hypothetical protein
MVGYRTSSHHGVPRRAPPRRFDACHFLMQRIAMRGYSADDDVSATAEWEQRAIAWQRFARRAISGRSSATSQPGPSGSCALIV